MATIIGDGPANSCGPQILEENTAYLVYGKHEERKKGEGEREKKRSENERKKEEYRRK